MQLSILLVSFLASLAFGSPTKRGGGGDDGGSGSGGDGGGSGSGGDGGSGSGGDGDGGSSSYVACATALYSQANCCSADVLGGVADLNCATVSSTPTSLENFEEICAEGGKEARCCTLDAITLGLICNTPA